jgi:hypothetical protein
MLILVPALFTGYIACVGADTSDETNGAVEAQITSAPTIIGTFRNEQSGSGIAVLTLKTDWTFHLEEGLVCVRAPCPLPEVNGSYRVGQLNGDPVLMLQAEVGDGRTQFDYLRYLFRDDVLYVAPVARYSMWQKLPRSEPAWCGVQSDCSLQNLDVGPCAGQWYCASNACNFSCGPISCEKDNSCPRE